MYVYGLCLLFDFATKNLPLGRQMRLKDFVNFEPYSSFVSKTSAKNNGLLLDKCDKLE